MFFPSKRLMKIEHATSLAGLELGHSARMTTDQCRELCVDYGPLVALDMPEKPSWAPDDFFWPALLTALIIEAKGMQSMLAIECDSLYAAVFHLN